MEAENFFWTLSIWRCHAVGIGNSISVSKIVLDWFFFNFSTYVMKIKKYSHLKPIQYILKYISVLLRKVSFCLLVNFTCQQQFRIYFHGEKKSNWLHASLFSDMMNILNWIHYIWELPLGFGFEDCWWSSGYWWMAFVHVQGIQQMNPSIKFERAEVFC